jgi:hypothetical protein
MFITVMCKSASFSVGEAPKKCPICPKTPHVPCALPASTTDPSLQSFLKSRAGSLRTTNAPHPPTSSSHSPSSCSQHLPTLPLNKSTQQETPGSAPWASSPARRLSRQQYWEPPAAEAAVPRPSAAGLCWLHQPRSPRPDLRRWPGRNGLLFFLVEFFLLLGEEGDAVLDRVDGVAHQGEHHEEDDDDDGDHVVALHHLRCLRRRRRMWCWRGKGPGRGVARRCRCRCRCRYRMRRGGGRGWWGGGS